MTSSRTSFRGPLAAALVSLILILAWDFSGLDLPAARLFGQPYGFPWRSSEPLLLWLHEVPRYASWVLLAGLLLAIRWPVSFLRQIDRAGRVQLALTVCLSVAVVSIIKTGSRTSCPWDLQAFGGMARHVSHWAFGAGDGGPGKCFPAGHASAAFGYLGGWFVLRHRAPKVAGRWLAVALLVGLVLGLAQQMRGAHYMSHTLWTAWICWAVGLAIEFCAVRVRDFRDPSVQASGSAAPRLCPAVGGAE
ncbi:phosphatase PAP2 family protein [Variovorax rhizosphaerae]|uniref:Phosphatase PAP2 family protein n=1 Tax=Variovorax rhizosphaerae TaxID=1836200 RepID=A0ABU8WIX7_9BURK